MKWETWFSRLNLIIGLIFPFEKKGQLGKKILFYVQQVYNFPFFFLFFLQLSTNISYKPYLVLRNQLLCSPIWLPESNKSERNWTGDLMGHLASFNSIPPTSFVFLFKLVSTVYTAKYFFFLFPSCCDLWTQSVSWFFINVINFTLFKFLITNLIRR